LFVFGGGGSHIGNSSVVALVFGFGMHLSQISVILNHCIKARFFGGLYKLQSSCGCYRALLTDSVGMLVSWIGGGSGVGFRPFVVHPPSCRGGRFRTTERYYGGVRLTGAVLSFLGVMFQHRFKYFITF
jgi:hypothetical protein